MQEKQVKICGLKRPEDIEYVNALRPDYIGFVIDFPKSHRSLTFSQAEELRQGLSKDICPVGVFVDEDVDVVAKLLNNGVIDVAQLHGREDKQYIEELRTLTHKKIWKAFQVTSAEDVKKVNESTADFIILDAGQGSGRAFDWELLSLVKRPYGLAGGLDINNLKAALKTEASLLDVSGGVETEKKKDFEKMKAFVLGVRRYR